MTDWPVPAELRGWMRSPSERRWVDALPGRAARLAREWDLVADGSPWHGFWSAVWPVRGADGRAFVLKIGLSSAAGRLEAAALQTWRGAEVVGLLRCDTASGALLLERLDGDRSLETEPDIHGATGHLAGILASLGRRAAPAEAPTLPEVAAGWAEELRRQPRSADVDRAVDTLSELAGLRSGQLVLVHQDLHFRNVLASVDAPTRWLAIDPLPMAGIPEVEVVAMLRNRWSDAAATGDADRALRRRVDQLSEAAGLDPVLARRVAQAVAVYNLECVTARSPDLFGPPYRVMSRWT